MCGRTFLTSEPNQIYLSKFTQSTWLFLAYTFQILIVIIGLISVQQKCGNASRPSHTKAQKLLVVKLITHDEQHVDQVRTENAKHNSWVN